MKSIFNLMNARLSNVLLVQAQEIATKTGHKNIEPIDILISLLQDADSLASQQIKKFFPQGILGVKKLANTLLKEESHNYFLKRKQKIQKISHRKCPYSDKLDREIYNEEPIKKGESVHFIPLSPKSNKILEKALEESAKLKDPYLGTYHVFLACLHNKEIYQRISKRIFLTNWKQHLSHNKKPTNTKSKAFKACQEKSPHSFVTNISLLANNQQLEPFIGRNKELETLILYLGRRRKNNVLLLGEPGVGKTALVEGIAQKILSEETPPWLSEKKILSLDIAGLVAGTRYRGDLEERFKNLLNEIQKDPNCIIFIDEIHMIVGGGNGEGSTIDLANMLKPILSRSSVQIIGATTLFEYRKYIEQDKALTRRFQILPLSEPNEEECLLIINNLVPSYEKFHELKYTQEALELAISLTQSYIPNKRLPDKAIDILDIASAQKKMQKDISGYVPIVKGDDIKESLETILRTSPFLKIHSLEKMKKNFQELQNQLNSLFWGNRTLVKGITNQLLYSIIFKSKNSRRPFLTYLLLGKPRTGKTCFPKALSRVLWNNSYEQYFQFDLTDYSDKESLYKLIGTPIGFSSNKEGGLLTETVKQYPNSILTFRNVNKAHPSVIQLLLKITREGQLTDNKGNLVYFSHNIIFFTMTINQEISPIGFVSTTPKFSLKENQSILSKFLPLDFLKNLTSIYLLTSPKTEGLHYLFKKKVEKIKNELKKYNISLEISFDLITFLEEAWHLSKEEFHDIFGFFKEKVENPIMKTLLENTIKSSNSQIKINLVQKTLKFSIL